MDEFVVDGTSTGYAYGREGGLICSWSLHKLVSMSKIHYLDTMHRLFTYALFMVGGVWFAAKKNLSLFTSGGSLPCT